MMPIAIFGMPDDDSERSETAFAPPADIRFETGYGATLADIKRGWIEPEIADHPEYDLANYKDRLSMSPTKDMMDDFEFRNHNRRATGFLTRPRTSTER